MDTADQPVLGKGIVQSEARHVAQWLTQFDAALHSENQTAIALLFAADSHWRDLLAFTWSITPSQGAEVIAALMVKKQAITKARGFAIAAK